MRILKKNIQEETRNFIKDNQEKWGKNSRDITVSKTIEEHIENEDGTTIIKRKKEKTNLTRKINETAKVLKQQTAIDKIKELKNIANTL